ncbi:hypothetical protein GGR50DRAFT_676429 [Xylaria sp. CBS 124048]|nr:hypothetical protein GGR50DRAFT_676429 [Xylaria sp. CBS 124048]
MSLASDETRYQPRRSAPRFEEASPQPWTTTRCHRLLRPLVSRIASLRKDAATCSQPTASASIPTSGTASFSSTKNSESDTASTSISTRGAVSSRGSGPNEELDEESGWLMPRKKRPRLTYSQRRGTRPLQPQHAGTVQNHPGQDDFDGRKTLATGAELPVKRPFKHVQPKRPLKATAPGEIAAPTPLLRRARGKIASPPVAPIRGIDFGAPKQTELDHRNRTKAESSALKRLDERLLSLRERLSYKYANLESIYRSLEALLRATAPGNADIVGAARGPRSLLEMCLRKVPQYIVELEAWERLEAEESGTYSTLDGISTSAQVYDELEALGTNVGWRHLRVVVRADGLNAVKRGIEEGLFGDEFSQLTIDLCIQLGATSEAEELITAFVDRQYPQPTSTESYFAQASALQPLIRLNSFADRTQRTSFLFRQYSLLLSSGSLPRDWLATSGFGRIWKLATQELASGGLSYDAVNFITQSILLLSTRKRTFTGNDDLAHLEEDMAKASQRTLMSSLSILASMRLLGESELGQPDLATSDIQRITIIGNSLRHVIRSCLNGLEGYRRSRDNQTLGILYLTLFLSSGQGQDAGIEDNVRGGIAKLSRPIETLLSSKELRMRKTYDNIAWLIASIARAYGRGASVTPHRCLDGLFERLESLELEQRLLDNLKAAAAFLIAQQTSNVRDLIYAENLHLRDRSNPGAPTQGHDDNTLFTGYRWEDTIGEWVTVSPVRNKRRISTIKDSLRSSTLGESRSLTRPTNTSSFIADAMSDTEISPDEDIGGGERSTYDEGAGWAESERGMMMKKRPARVRDIKKLTGKTLPVVAKAPVPQEKLVIPTSIM